MNLMSKCYLISLMSKVLERDDVTQFLKKSDHITPYCHGLILDAILLQWFPYDLFQHYISIYIDIFWMVTLSSITMHFYAFPHALLHNPTITHHGQAQRFNQATIHTSLPDILPFKILLASKNIQYNDENLHFCTTHISHPSTEKYSV